MTKANISILGITETKKKGTGIKEIDNGHILIYSGVQETDIAQAGVGCIITKKLARHIKDWQAITERLIRVTLEGKEDTNIVVGYGPNENDSVEIKDKFWEDLQTNIEALKGNTYLVGDLNARVGRDNEKWHGTIGKYGEETLNNNGRRLLEFCIHNNLAIANTFFQHREIHKFTREMLSRNEKSIIDYIITEKPRMSEINDVRVKRGAEIGSDHYLLVAKIKINDHQQEETKNKKNLQPEEEKIRAYKLKIPEFRNKYKNIIQNYTTLNTNNSGKTLEEKWTTFKNMLLSTAKEACGTTKQRRREKHTNWWNSKVKEEIKKKKILWKHYIQNKTNETYEHYKTQRDIAKAEVRKAKQTSWEDFGNIMESNFKSNQKLFYKVLKQLGKNKQRPINTIKNKKGELITEGTKILERWKEYFEELLSTNQDTNTCDSQNKDKSESKQPENYEEISQKEITDALKKLKLGKSAGHDKLTPEMLKYMGKDGEELLRDIINQAWKSGEVPADWKIAIIVPIHKKGDIKDCNNYRGISLLSVVSKLYERILESRLRDIIEPKLEQEQAGFRPGYSTQDHIFTIRQISEKLLERNRDMYVCFIDLVKAFDMILRTLIWKSLENNKVPKNLIHAIQSLYKDTLNYVRTGNITSTTFKTTAGVRQGGVLSPLLFIIVMNEVIKHCKDRVKELHVGFRNLNRIGIKACAFADDLVIFANSEKALQESLIIWKECLENYGMSINEAKTKVMNISKHDRTLNIKLGSETLQQVENFKYLGSVLDCKGTMDADINERISATAKLYYQLQRGFIQKREISRKTKLAVFRSVYIPTLTYGCESWTISKRSASKLQASEMKYLRAVKGVSRIDRIRNENIRRELGAKELSTTIDETRLRWFGHIQRMGANRPTRKIWEAKTGGRRTAGRPRATWDEEIGRVLKSKGLESTEARELAEDRQGWRNFVKSN